MSRNERLVGKCLYCGEGFDFERVHKTFCKPAHRVAYNRLPARIETAMQSALDAIYLISELTDKHPRLTSDAIQALGRVAVYAEFRRDPLI